MSRRLANFIDAFEQFGQIYNAPDRYLRWAGLFIVTSLAKRSIGVKIRGDILYPNLYVQMVGGPSTGKSQTAKAMRRVIQGATRDVTFIPKSLTRAGMQDFMAAAMKMRKDVNGSLINSSEFIGISDELQGILPDQDLGHLTLYNELYDNPKIYSAVTRSNGEVRLEYPYCSMFTGVQPQFLALTMPEGAWGMGFMSRTIMVWGTAKQRTSAFTTSFFDEKLLANLCADAKDIFNLHGVMTWTRDAVDLYERWWVEHGGNPIPTAKRLAMGYNGRREMHVLKMAMGFSLAKSDNLIVDEPDVADAITMLLEAETQMPHIFNEMSASGSMIAIEDVIDFVRTATVNGKDTSEAALIDMLMQRFPPTQVKAIIDNLVNSKALEMVGGINAPGLRKFKVGASVPVV